MTKKREHDPELESLLNAFREVHPSPAERDQWRNAIAEELREISVPPKSAPVEGGKIYRFLLRAAVPVGLAASLGFVIGVYFVEKRIDAGQTMLFSQTEPEAMTNRPPTTMDESREVVRVNLDLGESR